MKLKSANLKVTQADNVFVDSKIVELSEITKMPVRKGLENAVISNGKIVNVVSKNYGHLPNEDFFNAVNRKLQEANIDVMTRQINRDDRSFVVDYILQDSRYLVDVYNNSTDVIRPMIRAINSYDGSCKTTLLWGMYREFCKNGLHSLEAYIHFAVKHRRNIAEVVLPQLDEVVAKFMSNEFYQLKTKFEVMGDTLLGNVNDFVKITAQDLALFMYEKSETNAEPCLNAQIVLDTINRESELLKQKPNLWLGYNAFNELLHGKLKQTFNQQAAKDAKLFDYVYGLSN